MFSIVIVCKFAHSLCDSVLFLSLSLCLLTLCHFNLFTPTPFCPPFFFVVSHCIAFLPSFSVLVFLSSSLSLSFLSLPPLRVFLAQYWRWVSLLDFAPNQSHCERHRVSEFQPAFLYLSLFLPLFYLYLLLKNKISKTFPRPWDLSSQIVPWSSCSSIWFLAMQIFCCFSPWYRQAYAGCLGIFLPVPHRSVCIDVSLYPRHMHICLSRLTASFSVSLALSFLSPEALALIMPSVRCRHKCRWAE